MVFIKSGEGRSNGGGQQYEPNGANSLKSVEGPPHYRKTHNVRGFVGYPMGQSKLYTNLKMFMPEHQN